ncbi:fungal-specific transcription factor domain-containing protein [Plectosphaerella plurivora]|uniref:Fungal-specific transcription factor domain-containing protein n=1 Tax=Plectosphaerella plurivora TaxID=936078 RepID=A0A9P8VBF2_9PEZI|nr:fungal-specific transcription factor domain-containing protein [Plectosphaerella plurivora]
MSLSSPEDTRGSRSPASEYDCHPPPDPTPGSSSDKPGLRRKLACVECRRRKIKCDREHPCLSCILGGRQCELPAPGPPRRPRRRNHHELHDRLAGLEALLKQCVSSDKEAAAAAAAALAAAATAPESPEHDVRPSPSPSPGYLVQTPSGVEFRDRDTLKAIYQDLPTVQAILQVEAEQAAWLPPQTRPSSAMSTTPPFIPSANDIIVLWRIYLDRVDPVTKIIHVPSFRPHIIDAAAGFRNMSPQKKGLLFAMFTVACLALSRQEHLDLLGRRKEDTIDAYSASFKAVLVRYGYLNNYDLDTLRSLVLYAFVQKSPHGNANLWVFNGLLISMAHRLGIHIDGTRAGLSIFETEMRRRLWWMIIQSDVKETIATGVGSVLLPRNREARLPLNVNDDDLDPEMTEEPTPHLGFTEMTYRLLSYEVTNFFLRRRSPSSADVINSGKGSSDDSPPFMSLEVILDDLQKSEHKLAPLAMRLPDPNDPLQAMALRHRANAIRCLTLTTEPMEETPEWGSEVLGPEDNLFRTSLIALEIMTDSREQTGPKFVWYANLDISLDTLCFLAVQLQTRVAGSLADRAWALVGRLYRHHEELWDLAEKEKMTLGNLLLAAWQSRVNHFAAKRIGLPEPPFLARLRDEIMMIKAQAINLF